ncbi:hypothetical protein [Alkalihalobacterium chitinilyticum]|uniref:Regulatory protein RecX n=1 Tax=Alkalihalobacterium chitinilyticum TaxID=2980103 RepID=A0ABT5VAR3_9BACI|nr:hypothetical protein [Alkalihalobacterium chitinilyticum]MDE5412216.1 hypothetical protein [Alkalihalobacterium chitinilyticum]
MEELYNQIQGYLNMDEEIPFEEFDQFYKKVLDVLNERNEQFTEEDIWKALFIVENLMSNADARSKETKGALVKKYKKMAKRNELWAKNFVVRLHKFGYNDDQINARFEKMFEDGPVEAN